MEEEFFIKPVAFGGARFKRGKKDDDEDPRKNFRKEQLMEDATKLRKAKAEELKKVRERYAVILELVGNPDIALRILRMEFAENLIEDAGLVKRK